MRLAQRVSRIGESATLKVARRAKELVSQGIDVIDFGPGEPDFDSPEVAVRAARQALADGFTKYTPAAGIPELRQALAERYARDYGASWGAGDVAVTVGGKGALFQLALALFEAGDEVILPTPAWVSFEEQIRFAGAEPVTVALSAEDGFRIHADAILERFTDRTRAVLINSPSNPTGGVITPGDLERLARACAERDVVLISDETYERFVYGGVEHASVASLSPQLADHLVLVGSFSKTYAMTGWRQGYLFAPPEILAAVMNIQSHAVSNPTSFAMKGALAALEGAEDAVRAMVAEYAARRELLIPRLNALPGVSCEPPDGAFYAFPDVSGCYRDDVDGSVAFAEFLLEEARVAVVPGAAFGDDGHVRISFACSRKELAAGLERIAEALGSAVPRV